MFLFVLINTVEMIWLLTDPDDDTTAILNTIDNCMLYVFTAECAFRILGTGLYIYFSDSWNKFDFSLVVISYATDILLSFMDFAKNARSARFLKISRLQKTLRITKSIKSFRIFKFCMNLLSSFYRIKQLLEIIIISLPAIWRTLSLILMMFYLWACVGCELFRQGRLERMDIKPYGISNYYTYAGGILELTHIMIANGWSELMFNYCERFELRHTGQAYFISFHAIVNIVLRSLLSGLVWEVFSFVDKTSNNANKDDKINEIDVEELSKNLKKNHFHTLRFKSVIMINDEEPDDLKYRVPLEIKGLRKEIKKEMGDDFRGKFKTKIPSQARKSVQVDLGTALTKDAKMRLHQKRASLTNAFPHPKSSMQLMKGKDNSQKCFKIKRIALENDIEKADSNFRMIPSITPAQTFENKLAGLNLDYGINDEKESHDNSQLINSPHKPQEGGESGKEMSQGNLFVDSQNKIVSFSDDLHVAEAEPTGKKDDTSMEILTQGFLCSPIKPKVQPFEDSKDKPQENSGRNQGKKIDAKSILPQKPNSDCEDDGKAGKEGFQFSKGPPHIPTNTNHSHTEKSSENKDELVLRKEIQLKTKTQQMNDKAIGKVPNVNKVYARRRSRI